MQGKITLITPPDFFENNNLSILFINLTEEEQDIISKFLYENNISIDINFYVFDTDPNIPWLFYAFNRCDYRFINFNNSTDVSNTLGSYLLSKSNTFFCSDNENLVAMYSHINQNRITNIKMFLERIFNDKT
jgi:hypothetical protein